MKPSSQAERDRAFNRFSERVAADRATFPYALPHDRGTALAWLRQFRDKGVWAPAELVADDPRKAFPANRYDSFKELTPSGVVGDARLASKAKGEKLLKVCAEGLAATLKNSEKARKYHFFPSQSTLTS